MPSVLERLPASTVMDGELSRVLGGLGSISVTVEGFSPADLTALVEAGTSLTVPDPSALTSTALDSLTRLAQIVPTDTDALLETLQDSLQQLLTDATGIGELLGPVASLLELLKPLLEQSQLLGDSVSRLTTITTGFGDLAGSLSLSGIAGQLEYAGQIFDLFPEIADVGPFQELKAQIAGLTAWFSLGAPDLSDLFRGQLQALAEALPVRLDAAMQAALQAINGLQPQIDQLTPNAWCASFGQTLATVEGIDVNDLSRLAEYQALLDQAVAQVNGLATSVNGSAQQVLAGLNQVHGGAIVQDLQNELLAILATIKPAQPGPLAGLFARSQGFLAGLRPDSFEAAVGTIDQEVDKLTAVGDFSQATDSLEEIANRVSETTQLVDQGIVQLSLVLTNLVTELQSAIESVDLAGLVSQVQVALGQLSSMVESLLPQVESLNQQLTAFVTDLGQQIEQLDVAALKAMLEGLLAQITGVLADPEVQAVLQGAEEGIADVVARLEEVSLQPVFDTVIGELDGVREQAASIDVDQLDDMLKLALIAACEVLRQIDFSADIAGVLNQQFDTILGQSTVLVAPLQDGFATLTGAITRFSPGELVADELQPPYETLLDSLSEIEPAQILKPLQDVHEALKTQLALLQPQILLAPLVSLHGQLVAALEALSPQALLQPLNAVLDQVTGALDDLGLDAMFDALGGALTQVDGLLSQLTFADQLRNSGLSGMLEQIDGLAGFLDQAGGMVDDALVMLIAEVPALDMAVIQPGLDSLQAAVATIEGHVNAPAILAQADQLSASLNTQDFAACLTDLTRRWSQQKARFAAVTPPPESAAAYTALAQRVQDLSPIVLLATPNALLEQVNARVDTLVRELRQGQQSLVRLLAQGQQTLSSLLPREASADGFKALLREALEEQFGTPVKELLRTLKARVDAFGGVFQQIVAIVAKLQRPLQVLTAVPATISSIRDSLLAARDSVRGVNLNFLQDELQGAVDAVVAQLNAIQPAVVLGELQVVYDTTLQALDGLYPRTAIEALDTIYRDQVLAKFGELNPQQTVAQPLDATYQEIVGLLAAFDIAVIFTALTAKLDELGRELEVGLRESQQAFDAVLAALPSISLLPAIDISVDIGF